MRAGRSRHSRRSRHRRTTPHARTRRLPRPTLPTEAKTPGRSFYLRKITSSAQTVKKVTIRIFLLWTGFIAGEVENITEIMCEFK
jgi:hypothetical protein